MGFFQARILECVAISYSRGSSWPRDWTHLSYIGRQILYHWANLANSLTVIKALSLGWLIWYSGTQWTNAGLTSPVSGDRVLNDLWGASPTFMFRGWGLDGQVVKYVVCSWPLSSCPSPKSWLNGELVIQAWPVGTIPSLATMMDLWRDSQTHGGAFGMPLKM